MIAMAAAWFGKSMLMQSPIGGFLKAVPRWVWILLAVAAAGWFAVHWHNGKVEELRSSSFAAGYAKAVTDGKQRVRIVERGSDKIATEIRSKTHDEIASTARRADALRLRGPGAAAACVDPGLSAAAGGHQPIAGRTDDPMAGMPSGEGQRFIALPFGETVDRAEIADANRIEVLAWREWHRRLTIWWAKVQATADKSNGGKSNGR